MKFNLFKSKYYAVPALVVVDICRNSGIFGVGANLHYGGAVYTEATWLKKKDDQLRPAIARFDYKLKLFNVLFEVNFLFWNFAIELTVPFSVKEI